MCCSVLYIYASNVQKHNEGETYGKIQVYFLFYWWDYDTHTCTKRRWTIFRFSLTTIRLHPYPFDVMSVSASCTNVLIGFRWSGAKFYASDAFDKREKNNKNKPLAFRETELRWEERRWRLRMCQFSRYVVNSLKIYGADDVCPVPLRWGIGFDDWKNFLLKSFFVWELDN